MESKDDITSLMTAAITGNDELVKLLIKSNPKDIGRSSMGQRTALMHAAYEGHAKCVEILSKTKELGRVDAGGKSALIFAAYNGHLKCVRILANTKESKITCNNGFNALMYAAVSGYLECVKVLLKVIDVNARAKDEVVEKNGKKMISKGWTATTLASFHEKAKCKKILYRESDRLHYKKLKEEQKEE